MVGSTALDEKEDFNISTSNVIITISTKGKSLDSAAGLESPPYGPLRRPKLDDKSLPMFRNACSIHSKGAKFRSLHPRSHR